MKRDEFIKNLEEVSKKATDSFEKHLMLLVMSHVFSEMSGNKVRNITENESKKVEDTFLNKVNKEMGETKDFINFASLLLGIPNIEEIYSTIIKTAKENVIKQLCKLGHDYEKLQNLS